MFCSSCGTTVTESLSYCNRCGAEVNAEKRPVPLKPAATPESLVWAIVAVSVGGLAMLIGLMAVMKEAGFSDMLIALFSLLSFLLLLGAESVFIWLMVRSKRATKEIAILAQSPKLTTSKLGARQVRALSEAAPSVTEHTTRTLEPIYRERKTE